MITLYINEKAIEKDIRFISAVDLTFDKEIYDLEITDIDNAFLKEIDNAVYEGNGYIVTPFGRTEIQNLSTGCKTLLLLNHSKNLENPVINVGECGKNVLDIIFQMENIKIYLDFCSIPNHYHPDKIITIVSSRGRKEMNLRDVFLKAWRKK